MAAVGGTLAAAAARAAPAGSQAWERQLSSREATGSTLAPAVRSAGCRRRRRSTVVEVVQSGRPFQNRRWSETGRSADLPAVARVSTEREIYTVGLFGNNAGQRAADAVWLQQQQQMQAQVQIGEVRRWYANMGKTPVYEVLCVDTHGVAGNRRILRRDLLRNSGLQPRDLRRIDPSLALTTAAPSFLVRDKAILINLGSVRLICHSDHLLLFEPSSAVAQSFLEGLLVRLAASNSARLMLQQQQQVQQQQRAAAGAAAMAAAAAAAIAAAAPGSALPVRGSSSLPGAVLADGPGADGSLLLSFGGGASGALVSEARQSSSNSFELEVVEAALMETTSQLDAKLLSVTERVAALERTLPGSITPDALEELRSVKQSLVELDSQAGAMRQLLLEVLDDEDDVRRMTRHDAVRPTGNNGSGPAGGSAAAAAAAARSVAARSAATAAAAAAAERAGLAASAAAASAGLQTETDGLATAGARVAAANAVLANLEVADASDLAADADDLSQRDEGDAVEEVENLLEYYLQRCETCHGEAERLLAGARDLEESISVALSSRRYEVNKLELMLSIGTFATAIGAMVASVFGMNLRSRLEMHASAFYMTSAGILLLCCALVVLLFAYTKRRRIL